MAESSRNFNFSNNLSANWPPSEYDEVENRNFSISSKYVCKPCNVELNSHEQYQQHLQGQKHFSKTSPEILIDRQTNDSSSNLNNMRFSQPSQDNLADSDREVLHGDSLGVGDNACTLCNVHFTSPSHRTSHYQGKKHTVVLNRIKIKDIPLRCEDCCMQFSSEISAKDHFDSERHKKKTAYAYGSNSSLPLIRGTDNTKWIPCNICNVSLNSAEQFHIHCNSDKHKKKELNSSTLYRRSSLMEPNCGIKERSLSDETETIEDLSNQTKDLSHEISTPRIEKKTILPKGFLSYITASANTASQNTNDYVSVSSPSKILNKLESSCNIKSSGSNGLQMEDNAIGGDLTKNAIDSSGTELKETFKKYTHADSDSAHETCDRRFSPVRSLFSLPDEAISNDVTTDSMKKVPNSEHLNNNPTDITAKSHNNSLTRTNNNNNNNLSLPGETTQSNNDYSEENILNEQIANIIDEISNITVTSPISENCISNESNIITNTKILKPHSTTGGGRQQSKTASSSKSSPETEEDDEIPYSQRMWIEKIEKNGKLLCYFCNLCESKLNQGAVKNHVEGINHRQKMMTRPVPERDLPPLKQTCEDATEEAFNLTTLFPRGYQVELFEKCHSTDSIIFLPTGTGKTLCASMIISIMLQENPRRSVLFLVDKVLLVFQQKKFIEGQLKQTFLRFDFEDNDKLVKRELNIACVCGGTVGTQVKPLWMHDIVISTAAFCSNMINQNVLRWSDFSLVVVDEAHHCVKNHPFKKIFSTQHLQLEKDKRPKVLGLTASPAGEETLEGTIKMLVSLSMNMGSAKIAIVERTLSELNKYKSNARLEVEMLPPSNEEMSFNFHLQKYLMQCLLQLKNRSNISDYIDFITSRDNIVLNAEKLDELQNAFTVLVIDKDKAASTSLLWHVKKITSALAVSLEMGIPLALEELKSLSDKNNNIDGFSKALELGLPCHHIKEMCEKYAKVMEDVLWEQDEIMSTVHFLIHKITDLLDKQTNQNTIVLVLVKQRATAVRLSAIMQKSNTMKQHNLSTISLIGHGAGTSTGMNVNDQKKTLEEIKNNQYQVIIATSVAEEGIDLPECSLVITMKPPTSITTLVQMRGRARKKNSLFLTICGNEKEKLKIENLLKQEAVMEKATQALVNHYKKIGYVA